MENHQILLVDDDPFIIKSIGPALAKKRYEVTTAESGREALDILENSTFDLVLVDLVMEDVDGFAILKAVKKLKKETFVVVLTGYDDVNLAIDCLRLGADDYLLKPCALEELLFRLRNCFEKLKDKRKIKQTQVELEESQKRLNEAQQLTHIGHWIWNLETQTLTWSDEIHRIFGVKPNDFRPSAKLFEDMIHPEDLQDFLSRREKMIEEKKSSIIEHRIIRPDGQILFVEERANLELDEHKDVICVLGTVQDITKRKQAEEALKEKEHKYRGIFNESVVAIYVFDEKKNFLDSNQAGLDLLGYSREELLNMSMPDVDADPVVVLPAQEQVLSKERIKNFEHQLKRKDGRIITVLNNSRPIEDFQGNVVGMQSTLINITDRRKSEEALRESEERFRRIVQDTNAGYFFIDREGYFEEVNNAWLKMHKFDSDDEIIGHHFSETLLDTDLEEAKKIVESLINGEPVPTIEFSRRNKDNSIGFHTFSVSPVVNKGKVTGLEGFLIDTTEKRHAEEQIKVSLKEKETLLQEIHHRVKNNMTVISSLLRLQANSMEDERLKTALMDSQNRVQSMSAIHETLYQSDNLSAVDMKTYLSSLTGVVAQNYSIGSKVNLIVETENILIGAKQASPVGLIVNELISNSFKYAFPDNQEGEIKIILQKTGNQIELEYADNGIGLPEDFDWKNAKSMGLNLVNILAENQLDGSIDTEGGNGTKFIIKFNIDETQM